MSIPPERVLLVDDDRNLLASFKRQFHNQLNLITAASGEDGIQAIAHDGPFAVVISDMQMPNMDGVEFLTRARSISPNTVRIMLTGNANLGVATQAINNGNVFRLLNKPVPKSELYEALIDGIQRYRLVTAEKELLNKTLKGTVNLLTDMLGLMNPVSHARSSRIKRYVSGMVRQLGLEDVWSYELAAMLSQLGCITLAPELLEKVAAGKALSESEQAQFDRHPQIGARFLKHIPRLGVVSCMIEQQNAHTGQLQLGTELTAGEKGILGGQILKVAIAFDGLVNGITGEVAEDAVAPLRRDPRLYDPALVQALAASLGGRKFKVSRLPIDALKPGMILNQDLLTHSGTLLVAKGQELSPAIMQHLLSSEENGVISGVLQVVTII